MQQGTRSSRTTRRGLLLGAAGLSFGAATFLPTRVYAQTGLPTLSTLRPSAKSWLWAPEDYTRALGLFDRFGLNVNSVASNRGVNITGVLGGDIDIAFGDPSEAINVRIQRQPVKIFAMLQDKYAIHVVLKKEIMERAGVSESSPAEKKAALLKGLRLGQTGSGAGPDMLFRYLATLAGLNPDSDMHLVSIQGAGPGMLAAVEQGLIDGFCFSSPTTDLAVQRGCGYLFQMISNPPEFFSRNMSNVGSTSERTLSDRRDLLVRYLKAISLGFRSIQDDPDKFKSWARGYLDNLDPSTFDVAYRVNYGIYPKDPRPSEELFQRNVEYLNISNRTRGLPLVPGSITFKEVVDPSIASEALSQISRT